MKNKVCLPVLLVGLVILLCGCETFQKARRADELEFEVNFLKNKVNRLQKEKEAQEIRIRDLLTQKDQEVRQIVEIKQKELSEKEKEISELEKVKVELEEKLKKEIGEYQAKLAMTERGLVITFLTEIFFDSGKDKIKSQGQQALDKVAQILNTSVLESQIAIEGHTDNEPIRYSGWKSNWELSSARALAVLHYLIDECGVAPERLSAVGYGEYRPVTSNDTASGRQQNRRVEIVILPSKIKKVKDIKE